MSIKTVLVVIVVVVTSVAYLLFSPSSTPVLDTPILLHTVDRASNVQHPLGGSSPSPSLEPSTKLPPTSVPQFHPSTEDSSLQSPSWNLLTDSPDLQQQQHPELKVPILDLHPTVYSCECDEASLLENRVQCTEQRYLVGHAVAVCVWTDSIWDVDRVEELSLKTDSYYYPIYDGKPTNRGTNWQFLNRKTAVVRTHLLSPSGWNPHTVKSTTVAIESSVRLAYGNRHLLVMTQPGTTSQQL